MFIKSLKDVVGFELFSNLIMGADLPVEQILTSDVSGQEEFPELYSAVGIQAKKEIKKLYLERLGKSLAVANLTDLLGKRVILACRGYDIRTDDGWIVEDKKRVYLNGSIIQNVGIFQEKLGGKALGRKTPVVYCAGPRFEDTKEVFLERNFFNMEDAQFEKKWNKQIYGGNPYQEGHSPYHHVIFAVLP